MNGIPERAFTEPDTIRLISTAYITEPALAPLSDTDAELAILEYLESLTSSRLDRAIPVPGGITNAELLTPAHGFGWTYFNAAFCYTRIGGNRFNGPDRGAWYAAHGRDAAATAQAEVAWHLTRELDAVGIYDNLTAYRELRAGFSTRLHDLTSQPSLPALSRDPDIAYPAGQALVASLLASGANGVLYPSARHDGGQCLAAFRPFLVQNVRLGNAWTFEWSGSRTPVVTPA